MNEGTWHLVIKIYTSLFIFRKGRNWRNCEGETEKGWRRQMEESGGGLLLNHVVILYSRPYVFASLTRGTQPEVAVGLCSHPGRPPAALRDWLQLSCNYVTRDWP